MTQVERWWPFSTEGLPEICSARGCYKDVKKPGPFCENHAEAYRLRHLVDSSKSRKFRRPRRPSYVSEKEWHQEYPEPPKLFPTNLYAIRTDSYVKFGVSVSVRKRLASIQTGAPEKLRLHGCVPAVIEVETAVHQYLKDERTQGEWFHWRPRAIAVASLIRAKDLVGLLELMDAQDLMKRINELVPQHKPRENVIPRPVDL